MKMVVVYFKSVSDFCYFDRQLVQNYFKMFFMNTISCVNGLFLMYNDLKVPFTPYLYKKGINRSIKLLYLENNTFT